MIDPNQKPSPVKPLDLVKIVVTLFIGLGALLAILAVFGLFAWLALWQLLLKLALAAGIIIVATLVISWLMQPKN